MKRKFDRCYRLGILLASLSTNCFADNPATAPSVGEGMMAAEIAALTFQTSDVGPHHRWRSVGDANGTETSRYMELATGLNRWDEMTGEWKEASVEIEVFEGGAISRRTSYDAIFSPSADDPNGVFDILLPGGPGVKGRGRLRGQCVGLAMTDKATGQSVWLAEIENIVGLAGQDEVIYSECLTGERGFSASLRYKLTIAGIAQDVILHTAIPSLQEMGFKADADVAVEVWTQLLDAPPSTVVNDVTVGANGEQKADTRVDFGAMHFSRGSAFPLDAELPNRVAILANSIPVAKEYVQLNGMQFLIESAPFTRLAPEAAKLRPLAAVKPRINGSRTAIAVRTDSDRQRSFPISWSGVDRSTRVDAAGLAMRPITPGRQLAMAGYLLDWDLNAGSITNFTFQSDTTYYVKGIVYSYGTTVMEPSVIKFHGTDSTIMIGSGGTLLMKTSPSRPAFFVARDDSSVGTVLPDGTNAISGYYGYPALGYNSTNSVTISNIRVRDAQWGVYFLNATGSNVLSHSQFTSCSQAVVGNSSSTAHIRNTLIYDADYALTGAGSPFASENVTFDSVGTLLYVDTSTIATNCLFVDVELFPPTIVGCFNGTNSPSASVFRTVGSGEHYLPSDSPYYAAGTTNIDATLLKELKQRTTAPPVVLSQSSYDKSWWATNTLRLFPQASRATALVPSIGYHYDPMDYVFLNYYGANALTNANVTIMPGTVVGTTTPIQVGRGTKWTAVGTAEAPICFYRYNTVQEDANSAWALSMVNGGTTQLSVDNSVTPVPDISLNFTRWGVPAEGGYHLEATGTNTLIIPIWNSEFYGGGINGGSYLPNMGLKITNSLFERELVRLYSVQPVHLQNCGFFGGIVTFPMSGGSNIAITNSVFDRTTLSLATTSVCHNYNGYTTGSRLPTGGGSGSNDVVIGTSMTYATGPFGRYYQTLTNLVDRGNTSATNLGLYHFTARSPGLKEGNSTVDIGYHYVASDPLGPDLIGYWRLDEESGTNAADSSGYGGNGTLVSGPTWGPGTVGSGGLTFDGIDDYVTVPDSSVLRVGANGADFSVAFWLYLRESATGSWRSLMHRVDGEIRTFAMWMRPYDDGIYFRISTTYSPDEGWGGTWNSIPTNQWMHVAYVKDGSNLRLYLNGSQNASAALMGTSVPSNGPLYIGKTPYFAGTACTLDDIRIYNRALTVDELAGLVSGVTWDADGDGIPDYREDSNGNGVLDSGETNISQAADAGFQLQINQPDSRFNLP